MISPRGSAVAIHAVLKLFLGHLLAALNGYFFEITGGVGAAKPVVSTEEVPALGLV